MIDSRPTLLSGIAPSGRLTLGNYLGAIRSWVLHQQRFDSYFPLVDLHAITVPQDTAAFAGRCRDFIALYLACGIDPERSAVFVQSHVPEHCELAWILQCHTGLGELNRMTQFKDKRRAGDVSAGLFIYPVLMAADILLYQTTLVPVGEDQRQHLELTRDLASRFNRLHGPVFRIPEAFIPDSGARIMALQDPSRKMSKSDPTDGNIVALLDPPATISRKLRRAVTDSGSDIVARADKPGITNLLNILSATSGVPIPELEDQYRGVGYGRFKNDVADLVIARVEPIQERFADIRSDEEALDGVLARGADKARGKARQTLDQVRDRLGLIPL
jgi:tryptophanyl-tRNA synthetase